ncbi:arsenate reductase (glutaredoxin) [Candidatus Woesearchaeota archaeon]|jgi:arsenate reductase (glutaredoxin)|nr:arsenate reductase (glutaredoxin) [Candidatus Woesearchaeota archaeon]
MLTIYHNPQCSKSRKTLEIILKRTKDVEIVEYLRTPPTKQDLRKILKKLNLTVIQIVRTKEKEFQEIINKDLSDEELMDLIVHNPILLERPIVINGKNAIIGRPPENVLKLLK